MGKKRKQDLNGKNSMPGEEMPLEEGTSDTFPASNRDVLMQLKEIIQVKVNTDECLQKLEDKVKKLEEKMKKNKIKEVEKKEQIKEVKEDLKRELVLFFQEQMQKLEEKVENRSKEHFSMFMEDFKKQPEEVKEEPYPEMQKEGSTKVNRCSESSSLRSQPHQSQTTSFHLKFACEMDAIVYKGKPILSIEVVLYDGDNPIANDHHLASAVVELVVVDGEFSGQIQGHWSKDEFVQSIMKSRQGNNSQGEPQKVTVKNGRFKLDGGRCCHKGAVIMENSNRKDVKLGVMIVGGNTKERVLEGISNSFRVQEAKTAEKRGKRTTEETPEDLPRLTEQNNSNVRNKKGNGSIGPPPSEPLQYPTQGNTTQPDSYGQCQQHIFPPTNQNVAPMPNQLKRKNAHTAGNGQPLVFHLQQQNTNQQEDHEAKGQQYSVPTTWPINFPNISDPSGIKNPYAAVAGNSFVGPRPLETLQYPTQQDTAQPESYGQGLQYCFPPANHNLATTANQLQRINAHTAGNGPGSQPVVGHLQQQNTTHHEDHGQDRQHNFVSTKQNFSLMSNQLQRINVHTTGGQPPVVVPSQEQNTTQQKDHGQGQKHTFTPTQQNIMFGPHQVQRTHARAVGNGQDGQPLLVTLQQRNTTLQETQGKGQQYSAPKTGLINFQNMSDSSNITYPYTTENRSLGPLPLEPSKYPSQHDTTQLQSYAIGQSRQEQQQNTTQQGATQLEDHGSSTQMRTSPCADDPLGEVVRLSSGLPDNPDGFEYTEPLQHAVTDGPGRHSAGTQHWGIGQLPRSEPDTEDEYQDDGAILCAPSTAVPAPERTQMDFTQAMTGSQAPRQEVHLLELQRQLDRPWQ